MTQPDQSSSFQERVAQVRNRLVERLRTFRPGPRVYATAFCVGATIGEYAALVGSTDPAAVLAAIGALGAQLGVNLLADIIGAGEPPPGLTAEEIAEAVQERLEQGDDLPAVRALLQEFGTLQLALQTWQQAQDERWQQLVDELSRHPQLIAGQVTRDVVTALDPRLASLEHRTERILELLENQPPAHHNDLGQHPPVSAVTTFVVGMLGSLAKAPYWVLATVVTGTVVLVIALAWFYAIPRPPTVYFVVDATEKMAPLFNAVRSQVQLAAGVMPVKVKVGLRIYGGHMSGIAGCRDTKQVVEPDAYPDVAERLESVLSTIKPSGYGSLSVAILDAVYNDLAERRGPIRLIVITSGTDSLCDPQEGGILESRAKDIRHDLDILIVSVGEISSRDYRVLDSYATAFRGSHLNIPAPNELPEVIKSVSYYGSNYLLERLTPTPTP